MVKADIINQLDDLNNRVKKDPPIFDGFKSEPGKEFQTSFNELLGFISLGNLALGGIELIPLIQDFIENIYKKFPRDQKKKAINEEPFSDLEIEESKALIKDTAYNLVNSFEPNDELKEKLSNFIERINAYFFLALYAYMDYYIEKLYESIRVNFDKKDIPVLDELINKRGDLNTKINKIKNKLKLVNRYEFGDLIRGRLWKENFNHFLCSRHIMAHKKPLARINFLNGKFPKVAKDIKNRVQSWPEKFSVQYNIDINATKKIFEIIKLNLYIFFMLFEISKDCFCYLAMIDILIDDKINPKVS